MTEQVSHHQSKCQFSFMERVIDRDIRGKAPPPCLGGACCTVLVRKKDRPPAWYWCGHTTCWDVFFHTTSRPTSPKETLPPKTPFERYHTDDYIFHNSFAFNTKTPLLRSPASETASNCRFYAFQTVSCELVLTF